MTKSEDSGTFSDVVHRHIQSQVCKYAHQFILYAVMQ